MRDKFKISILCISIIASNKSIASNQYKIQVSEDIPKGFENIITSNSFYDIYIDNIYLGTLETRGSNWIEFMNPERFMDNKKIKENIAYLNEILSRKYRGDKTSLRESDNYFVNFNPTNKTLHLISKISNLKEEVSSGFNWKSNISGYISGQDNIIENKTLDIDSYIGYNKQLFKVTGHINNDSETLLDNAYHSTLINGKRINTGIQSSGYSNGDRFIGISYLNNAKSLESGSKRIPIELLIKSPATITITKNSQVIYIANHKGNVITIDTNSFPNGNYSVDVKINYRDGTEEIIKKTVLSEYSNNDSLGLKHISIGATNESNNYIDINDYSDSNFFATASYKVMDNKLGAASIHGKYNRKLSIGLDHIAEWNNLNLNTRVNISTDNEHSISNYLSYHSHNYRLAIGSSYNNQDKYLNSNLRYSYHDNTFGNFDTGVSISNGIKSYNASHSYNLFQSRVHSLDIKTSADKRAEWIFGLSLSYRLSPSSMPFNYYGSAGIDTISSHYQHDLRHQYANNNQNISSSIMASNRNELSSQSISSSFIDNRYGKASGQIGMSQQLNHKKSYFNGSFNTGLTGSGKEIMLSGNKNIKQGVVIDLVRFPVDKYILMIDDKRYKISGGSKHAIELDPHKQYKISLTNENNPSIVVSDRKKTVYVDFNSTQIINWEFNQVSLLSARALINNNPVKNEKISSTVATSYTDDEGYFTLEILENEKSLKIKNGNCDISLIDEKLNFSNTKCLR